MGKHRHDRYTAPRRRETVCYQLVGQELRKGAQSNPLAVFAAKSLQGRGARKIYHL